MNDKKQTPAPNKTTPVAAKASSIANTHAPVVLPVLFTKDNYLWMAIGGILIALGMFLMSGGKNQDPNVFDTNVVYSPIRITVAPILILLGLVVEIYALFRKEKTKASE